MGASTMCVDEEHPDVNFTHIQWLVRSDDGRYLTLTTRRWITLTDTPAALLDGGTNIQRQTVRGLLHTRADIRDLEQHPQLTLGTSWEVVSLDGKQAWGSADFRPIL